MSTAADILEALDTSRAAAAQAAAALDRAAAAAITFARSTVREAEAKLADDDDWRRLPTGKPDSRCPISNWSRSGILRKAITGQQAPVPGSIRTKHIGKARFYSGADVRRLLNT